LYATARSIAGAWPPGEPVIDSLMIGLVLVVMTYSISTSILTPSRTNQRLVDLSDASSFRWVVASTGLAGVFLLDQIRSITIAVYAPSFTTLALSNAILVTISAILFVWALWPRRKPLRSPEATEQETTPPLLGNLRLTRLLASLLMASVPFVAVAGFFALSRYLSSRIVLTTLLIVVLWLVYRIAAAFFHRSAARDAAKTAADERKTGPERDEVLSWWLSVAAGAVLFVLGIALTAILWGASAADFEQLREAVFEGFDLAGVRISLGQILIALVVFGIGLWATRLVQAAADRRVLPRLRVETGARDSIRSALGYAGVFIAALIAIGVAGLNLTNAAIIAGALSVGIGFGLQAVVNNFVSGLILLFERPFKVGDWIVVGGAEGTVRRINVRATEIQTFDNATVIVPNSQFISGPVTNWMHKDTTGRVAIPVKLGQRIEPDKVRELLLAAAHAHPDVTSYPPPTVIMTGFAGGVYEFELRAFVRDVIKMSGVKSDLNFTIARQLHEKNLWVPTA
jgi:small-conductance mechanosensitive channel